MMTLRPLLLASLLLCCCFAARADQHHLVCTADTNLSSYEGERDLNYGQSTRLRLKGIQMLALFDFDIKPVANWQIRKATLYLRYAQADRKLRILGISTIAAAWKEGTGAGERKPGEVCFDWRELNQERWAGDATDFTDVSFTSGNTVTCYSEVKTLPNDWIAVDVEPKLVQAVIAGASNGLAVTDEKGQTGANNDIYSREQSGSEPYLVVEGEPAPHRPSKVQIATVVPDPRHADFESGAVKVTFKAPPDAFAFLVHYNDGDGERIVARSRIPLAQPGGMQTVVIDQLPARSDVAVDIFPVGATGLCGFDLWVKGKVSAARSRPATFARPLTLRAPTGVAVPPSGPLRIVAYPDTEKVNPISGNRLEEVGMERYEGRPADDYGAGNSVWDGMAIRLTGARNEFVACHLLIEATHGTLQQVVVQPAPAGFTGTSGQRGWQSQIGLFRDWYVRDGAWFPEACVPLKGAFDIPAPDNAVPGQRNQSIFVEMLIPRDTAPGGYRSWLTVSAAGVAPVKVPVVVDVNGLTLPDALSFDVSLNGYGTLGAAYGLDDRTPEYRALEREYHRMAHLHRSTLALLGYSHSGNISTNYAPPLAGDGAAMRVTDWSAWDAQFGPYLDGSAFSDLPRKGVPITHFYLPFHEDWPADIRAHYRYQATTTAYPALITEHAMAAPPIERALAPEFDAAFVAVVRQFAEHFRAKGWTRTQFQFYQNDKYFYKDPKLGGRGTSWWLLDEPNHRDDWLALAHFNRLFAQGIGPHPGVSLITREDISRPQWQRDYLDGLIDLMVVSGELYTKGPRLRKMQERLGVRYWNYGTANVVRRTNAEAEAWAVSAWLAGADGIVPWQTIGEDENFTRADETALLLPGKRFGIAGPVASLRLKALRRAQQDVEYLNLLAAAKGWDRAQIGAVLSDILQPKATFKQQDAQDAGSYSFGKIRAADFSDARRAAATAIAKQLNK